MNAVEKTDNRELAEISIVLPPFSPPPPPPPPQPQQQQQPLTATVVESPAAAVANTTSPAPVQTSITGNLISIPMHLATSRMVCLRAPAHFAVEYSRKTHLANASHVMIEHIPEIPTKDIRSQTIYPITSSPEPAAASTGHPIFISTSPNPTITPTNASSNGSAFVASDEDKISLDGKRKRPAPSIASTRQNSK
ncbi:unnamed protein product [Rodentolepis nana]|uniref:Uncharacterized protein n=1 Tax=Rodentolepis nana TaxID=102285 RepID=A0A0R3T5P3_RODNA|nr:unnamed protein product [Rodentolepis nana]